MDRTGETERIDTVVVGGGQAGLAVGYHLARRGLPFVILDASERIGDAWRNRWDSLRLFTPARYNGLPGSREGRRARRRGDLIPDRRPTLRGRPFRSMCLLVVVRVNR
jgi:cation diffusion facilitator CzcD-associated flavoprotein CzcO